MILSEARAKKNISQSDLAELTGIHQPQISLFETGRSFPGALTRYKIEQILGPVDWIGTKLHGTNNNLTTIPENESQEGRVIREIEIFVKSANNAGDQLKRYDFIAEYIDRKVRKTVLMDKVYRALQGEKVAFSAREKDTIKKAKQTDILNQNREP